MKLWWKLEYAFHMVEAYLATNRGDYLFAADCKDRAYEAQRQLHRLEIQL